MADNRPPPAVARPMPPPMPLTPLIMLAKITDIARIQFKELAEFQIFFLALGKQFAFQHGNVAFLTRIGMECHPDAILMRIRNPLMAWRRPMRMRRADAPHPVDNPCGALT